MSRRRVSWWRRLIGQRAVVQRNLAKAVSAIYGAIGGGPAYPIADPTNTMLDGFAPAGGSANVTLVPSLDRLIASCRHIERATPVGRAAAHSWVADLVGSGIGIEPDTGDAALNVELRTAFNEWALTASVEGDAGPTLWELQAQGARELFAAGAVLWRKVVMPARLAEGLLPVAVLPLEVEWLSGDPVQPPAADCTFVRGKELDRAGRCVRYHLRNPDDPLSRGEVVDAADIIHAYERRRPRMAHGEPELSAVAIRVIQDDDLVAIELRSAHNAAGVSVLISGETAQRGGDDHYGTDSGAEETTDAAGRRLTNLPVGAIGYTEQQGDVTVVDHKRPSQDVAKFRGTIRGDLAGSTRVSQQGLDRDASRASYSSSRADQQCTVKMMRPLQLGPVGRQLGSRVYAWFVEWYLIGSGRQWPSDPIARRRLLRHDLRPDVPEYVDPVKDALGAGLAVALNLSTLEAECARRGVDLGEVIRKRKEENAALAEAGLSAPSLPELRATAGLVADDAPAGQAPSASTGVDHATV